MGSRGVAAPKSSRIGGRVWVGAVGAVVAAGVTWEAKHLLGHCRD